MSSVPAPGAAEEYAFVSAELPAGHYRRVALVAEPGATGGRLRVRSLRLFDLDEAR